MLAGFGDTIQPIPAVFAGNKKPAEAGSL